MSTTNPRGTRKKTSEPTKSLRALVAAGSSPDGRATIRGELVWIPLPCGTQDCSCRADFSGVATRGITDVAQVQTLRGVSRAAIRRAIVAGMCTDCVPAATAPTQAEWLLRVAQDLPDGTLVRRDGSGAIIPLPPGSVISPGGRISSPWSTR